MSHLANLALALGEVNEAVERGHELVAILRTQRAPLTLYAAQQNLIKALREQGNTDEAEELEREANLLTQSFGTPARES